MFSPFLFGRIHGVTTTKKMNYFFGIGLKHVQKQSVKKEK